MAISLDRVHHPRRKKSSSKNAPTPKAAPPSKNLRPAKRPWQNKTATWLERPPMAQDLDFDLNPNTLFLTPEDLDAATTLELLKQIANTWIQDIWRNTQRQSYWLSRLTHQNSWLSRVQIFPRVRIPIPSWLSRRE